MGKEALERVGGEEAVQQDLDIVDGAVGEPLARERDEPRTRRRSGDRFHRYRGVRREG